MTFITRDRSRRIAWIATLAMLAAALLPSLAHARKAAMGLPSSLMEICTSAGLRKLAPPAADTGSPQRPDAAMAADCPFCLLHISAGPLPAVAALPLPAARHEAPLLFLRAPRPLFVWAAAGCRDPPRFA